LLQNTLILINSTTAALPLAFAMLLHYTNDDNTIVPHILLLCLTPIIGAPNSTSLNLLTKEIYANAHAIPSTLGGNTHGHLGLVLPITEYTMLAGGSAFQLPASTC